MDSNYVTNPLEFLISTLLGLYIMILVIRFLLGLVRADFYNPVSQFLVRVTNPLLIPLRRVVPAVGGIDLAAILLVFSLQMATVGLIALLRGGDISIPGLILWSLTEIVSLVFNIFIFSILIQAILSWVNPGVHNPVIALLQSLTEPILAPIRRMLPPMSGLDLSPLAAILALQVLKMLVLPPLLHAL